VSVRDELNLLTPRLRRYARALAGSHPAPSELADDLVRSALERMLECGFAGRWLDLEIRAYAALTEVHREALRNASLETNAALEKGHSCAAGAHANMAHGLAAPRDRLSSALGTLALEEKEALLLVVLEGFGYTRAAGVLKVSKPVLIARLARARESLTRSLAEPKPRLGKPTHLRLVK
jgi:RNA polymerase sigma-70 factor (ECF subfamily)